MTSHWSKYKKLCLKFNNDEKFDHAQCQIRLKEFLAENSFVDIIYKWDFAPQLTGYHVNIYAKTASWNKLRQYTTKNHMDMRFFLYINDLNNIDDTSAWISYIFMREKCNYEPQRRNESLTFESPKAIR